MKIQNINFGFNNKNREQFFYSQKKISQQFYKNRQNQVKLQSSESQVLKNFSQNQLNTKCQIIAFKRFSNKEFPFMSQALQSNIHFEGDEVIVPQQKPSKTPRLILTVSCLSLATFYCGYLIAYIIALGAQNLNFMYGTSSTIPVIKGFLIACIPYGIMFGTFLSPWVLPLASKRNLTLILCLIACVLEGVVQIQQLPAFFIVRFFQGTIGGLFIVLIPVYVRQFAPKQISSHLNFGIFEKLFLLFGLVVPFGFNTILLKKGVDQMVRWRIIVTANSLPIVILIILVLIKFIPESPHSLILKNRHEEAKKVIGLFHQQNVIEEIYQRKLKQLTNIEKNYKNIGKKNSKLKTFLTFQIPILHQFTGVNAYISQMGFTVSFINLGLSEYMPFLMASVQFVTTILSMLYIPRFTPRKILLVGNLGMGFCCFSIGIGLIAVQWNYDALWVVLSFLIILLAFNGATFIPVIGLYVAQVGSKRSIRWSLVSNWFFCGTSIIIYVTVGSAFGFGTVFIAFGIITMIGFIFNIIWMIETKPKLKDHVIVQLRPNEIKIKK